MSAGSSLQGALSATNDAILTDRHNLGDNQQQLVLVSSCTGVPPTTANTFSHGCLIIRTDGSAASSSVYQNTGTSAVPVWTVLDTALPGDTASSLIDTNSVTALDVGTTASAVNNLRVTNSATGAVSANAVLLSAVGTDAAISIQISPKGATGLLNLGLATGTGTITVGSSSAAQTVAIGAGAGASTVLIAGGAGANVVSVLNTTVAGATYNLATAATGAGVTDTANIMTGNAAATGVKVVNILTGTPGTSGNNRLTIGGGTTSAVTLNAVRTSYQANNRVTGSAVANAPVGTLVNAAGSNITVAAGLEVTLLLTAGLQAGANTFNLNGHGADSIKKATNPANDLGTAFVTGSFVKLIFDGTVWQCQSQ